MQLHVEGKNYNGHGLTVVRGDTPEVDDELGKYLIETFPAMFSKKEPPKEQGPRTPFAPKKVTKPATAPVRKQD